MNKTVYIVIGCDTDPDREGFVGPIEPNTLSWRGMLEGIPAAKERLKDILDSDGKPAVFTWCLRVDYQIKKIHGRYDYILTEHKDFLTELERSGDELGWHPHFWNDDKDVGTWYQEIGDADWQVAMLNESHGAYQSVFPGRAKSVRTGWDYHNNRTFAALQELGVEVDFSGVPGLQILPKDDRVRSANFFDWSLSPTRPYYPAKDDYRREAKGNEPALTLLEAPNFVSNSFIWGMIAGLVLAKKMRDIRQIFRAVRRPTYFINITGKPSLFAPLAKQLGKTLRRQDEVLFATYFHPDELIENPNPLYSLDNLADNLKTVLSVARQHRARVKFIRAMDIKTHVR